MKRRKFLEYTLATPFYFKEVLSQNVKPAKHFNFLEISGDYKEIGFQIGKHFAYNINELLKRRAKWHKKQ